MMDFASFLRFVSPDGRLTNEAQTWLAALGGGLVGITSNANGLAFRFNPPPGEASGLQVCTHTATFNVAIDTAFLGGFRTGAQTWTFPLAFSVAPVVVGAPHVNAFGLLSGTPMADDVNLQFTAVTSQSAADRTARLVAVGLWEPA